MIIHDSMIPSSYCTIWFSTRIMWQPDYPYTPDVTNIYCTDTSPLLCNTVVPLCSRDKHETWNTALHLTSSTLLVFLISATVEENVTHKMDILISDTCSTEFQWLFWEKLMTGRRQLQHLNHPSPHCEFNSVPWLIGLSAGHDRWFSRNPCPVFSAGGHCEQFWHEKVRLLFDIHLFSLPKKSVAHPPRYPERWFWRGCERTCKSRNELVSHVRTHNRWYVQLCNHQWKWQDYEEEE